MSFLCFVQLNGTKTTSIIVFVVFVVMCKVVLPKHIYLKGTYNISGGKEWTTRCIELMWRKDVSKVVDYLKVGSQHHVRSYFWWGGIQIEQIHRGGDTNRKTQFQISFRRVQHDSRAHARSTLFVVLAVCVAPELGRKRESCCLIHSLIWEQWSAFRRTQTRCGHVSNTWNVYSIFHWCALWNNNAQQTCKITQLMMIHGKSTMVASVAFSIRSHTCILNLMYDTNIHLLEILYDIW